MKYMVIKALDEVSLFKDVNEWIETGWKPLGGVGVSSRNLVGMGSINSSETIFAQAMIKPSVERSRHKRSIQKKRRIK